ncbi:MAG: hypothetical protein ACFCU5_18365 [Pleurocapsa sp.]
MQPTSDRRDLYDLGMGVVLWIADYGGDTVYGPEGEKGTNQSKRN